MVCPNGKAPATRTEVNTVLVTTGWPIAEKSIGGIPTAQGVTIPVRRLATEIVMLESGGCAFAHAVDSDDDSYGWFQINLKPGANDFEVLKANVLGLRKREDLFNPIINSRTALYLYKSYGFKPWSTAQQAYLNLAKKGEVDLPGDAARNTDIPVISNITSWAAGLTDFLSAIMNPTFWKWVGLGALGVMIAIISTILFTDTGQTVAKGAATKGLA
jgi:hypothetical protein